MKFIDQLDLKKKKVLIRVDYNVPIKDGQIVDEHRIVQGLATLEYLLKQDAALIICCHLGKPKGQYVPELSLAPVADRLSVLLKRPVALAPDCIGDEVETMAKALQPGQIMLLENLRFHPQETAKNPEERQEFGKSLAALAEVYVNDAFGVVHRENSSVVDVPRYLKLCCGGFLLKREWEYLGAALKAPKRPLLAISGGAKVSTKLAILKNFLGLVDHLIIGGAMANTFLLAQGINLGASLIEPQLIPDALDILKQATQKGTHLHLPVDLLYAPDPNAKTALGICNVEQGEGLDKGQMALDIGPKTAELYAKIIAPAATVVWNGPMGFFENPAFATGSKAVCTAIAKNQGLSIVGGGDTDAMLHSFELAKHITFVSTGGGSFMEFMEGKELPGFKALKECSQ